VNLNNLKDERHAIFTAAGALVSAARASKRDLAGEDLRQYEGLLASMKVLDAQIEQCSKVGASAHHDNTTPVVQPMVARDAGGKRLPLFAKGQSLEAHVRQAGNHSGYEDGEVTWGGLLRAMAVGGGSPAIRAALSEGTDSAGGVTVSPMLTSQLVDMLRARSTVFESGALTLMLDTGKTTTLTAIASDPVATWRAENAAVAVSDATFTPITLTPKSLAVIVVASQELVEDGGSLLEQALMLSLTKSFAAEIDRVALIGSGASNQPKGLSLISGVGSISMGVNGLALTSYDPFVTALGTLQTANAADPTAVIFHARSAQEINLLKDSQNRPLARPACLENLPFRVTSKLSIAETQGTSSTCSRAFLGNFAELIVGIRHSLSIQVLREKYADSNQFGFLAQVRADIGVRHAASFCQVVGIL
jgi:HK97 family phage major capsid protein